MRIISGKLGGRKLFSSSGNRIRPTSDRVREALFNILSYRIESAAVLDLFAGTGALGIESASRGAAPVVCIDISQTAIGTIQKNMRSLALEDTLQTIKWDIARNLNCVQVPVPLYDLVFLDPPYEQGLVEKALENLHRSQSVKPGATLVVEHSIRESLPEDRPYLVLTDQRKYGKTLVSFLTYMV
ncbi:MAG: 16S rRNA (guanine(966)-N(2))-methyltransferase RsmD [Desulfobacterales bacterium]|nr:16S rRNA (guanine(966)-N(2))-methyltransferase RsmD [Desulfobacterales bacterium]